MMRSKFVRKIHHMSSFLRRYMLPQIHLDVGHKPGTTAKEKKKKIWLSLKGGPFD